MVIRWLFAALHLLALGIGLGAIWARARTLRGPLDSPAALGRVFYADTWWGIAAVIWIGTGLTRLLAGLEKATTYYVHNDLFLAKMVLLVIILVLELWPMTTLIRWRIASGRGQPVQTTGAPAMARISMIQATLIVLMVAAATAMARGLGERAG